MGSLFDSEVRERRQATPWAIINPYAFMRDMALNGKTATLTCTYRPSVASRFWYSLSWTDEQGQEHRTEAQELDLCLWRAAETELQVRSKKKKETL